MSIFMSKFAGDDYSAMQGPCPDGFHVPLQSEWEVTYEILVTSFGLDDNRNTIQTYLKMPSAGYRFIYGGAAIYQDYYGYYWSCSGASSDAYYLDSSDSHIYPDVQTSRTYGCTLRAFKNTATAPDSSWTTLYQGTGAAGIYHNSSLGLISLSSDGSNWITIADKNVGATQIYNNGDTLSEANCGKYYQRGNNYGFAWTGSVTTSSSTVNASTYGPGNYYNSSTFITGSYWDTSGNNNLRGGETGVVQSTGEPKKIYIRVQAQPITTAGIYHNSDLGLISLSSDGSNWITIADKNLGATTVYNSGDTLSEANCGKYYQWGNNYGFPFTGGVTTSSTKVNASTYGPGNYYSSSTFITANPRDNSGNNNLRGGETGTNEAMKGPCSSGFHIPLSSERNNIYTIWTTLGGGASDGTNFGIALKLPFGGYRSRTDASVTSLNSLGQYWASNIYIASFAYALLINSSSINSLANGGFSFGMMVRPFKNEAVQPDDSRTKLY